MNTDYHLPMANPVTPPRRLTWAMIQVNNLQARAHACHWSRARPPEAVAPMLRCTSGKSTGRREYGNVHVYRLPRTKRTTGSEAPGAQHVSRLQIQNCNRGRQCVFGWLRDTLSSETNLLKLYCHVPFIPSLGLFTEPTFDRTLLYCCHLLLLFSHPLTDLSP